MKRLRSVMLSCAWLLVIGISSAAQAQVCTASSSGLAFGQVSPVAALPTATGQISISCTALLAYVKVCISIGAGTGETSYAPRYARSATLAPLAYNLYTDATGSTILGSRAVAASYAPGALNLAVPLGTATTTFTVYGKLQSGQTAMTAGAYTANFADASIAYKAYGLLDPVPDCATLTQSTAQFQFPVTATVISDCTIGSTNIDFGSTGLLTSTLTASGTLSVTCTNASPYTISLSAGNGTGATTGDRRMTRTGGTDQVSYGLYSSTAYGTQWGDGNNGTAVVSKTGAGVAQQLTVYARVLPQPTPRAGAYLDSVIATISY
jgi:spore coat protein U-like protein